MPAIGKTKKKKKRKKFINIVALVSVAMRKFIISMAASRKLYECFKFHNFAKYWLHYYDLEEKRNFRYILILYIGTDNISSFPSPLIQFLKGVMYTE